MSKLFTKNVKDGIRVVVRALLQIAYYTFVTNPKNFAQAVRKLGSALFMSTTLLINTVVDLFCNGEKFKSLGKPMVDFLERSQIGDELIGIMNERLTFNMNILRDIQTRRLPSRHEVRLESFPENIMSLEQVQSFVRHSVAIYGQAVADASDMDARREGNFYIGMPRGQFLTSYIPGVRTEDDIISHDMGLGETIGYMRHLLVVDHDEKAIVLSFRGTTAMSSAIVDVLAFSEEFCDGHAHSGMAVVTRNTWDRVKDHVTKSMVDYPDYSFITTGHSLGGGVATLLNILLHYENFMPDRTKKCIAFAPPPTFYPLHAAETAVRNCTACVHSYDIVASLSVDSVRRTLKAISIIDEYTKELSDADRREMEAGGGPFEIPRRVDDMIEKAQACHTDFVSQKDGAPELSIPAQGIIWLEEQKPQHDEDGEGKKDDDEDEEYNAQQDQDYYQTYSTTVIDPIKFSKRFVDLDPLMFDNHFIPAYAAAIETLMSPADGVVTTTTNEESLDAYKNMTLP